MSSVSRAEFEERAAPLLLRLQTIVEKVSPDCKSFFRVLFWKDVCGFVYRTLRAARILSAAVRRHAHPCGQQPLAPCRCASHPPSSLFPSPQRPPQALRLSNATASDLAAVVPVGGAARVPSVRALLKEVRHPMQHLCLGPSVSMRRAVGGATRAITRTICA